MSRCTVKLREWEPCFVSNPEEDQSGQKTIYLSPQSHFKVCLSQHFSLHKIYECRYAVQYVASKPLLHFFSVARECSHVARCNAPARLQHHKDVHFTRKSPRPRVSLLFKQVSITDALMTFISLSLSTAAATSGDGSMSSIALVLRRVSQF